MEKVEILGVIDCKQKPDDSTQIACGSGDEVGKGRGRRERRIRVGVIRVRVEKVVAGVGEELRVTRVVKGRRRRGGEEREEEEEGEEDGGGNAVEGGGVFGWLAGLKDLHRRRSAVDVGVGGF